MALTDDEISVALRATGTLTGAARRLGLTLNGLRYRLGRSPGLDALAWEVCRSRRHRGIPPIPEARLLSGARTASSLDRLADALDVTRQYLWKAHGGTEVWNEVVALVAANRPVVGMRTTYDRTPSDSPSTLYAEVLRHDPCSYCGRNAGHLDHVDAVSRGGSRGWKNFTAACRSCNSRKRATPMLLFMLKRAHGVRRLDDCRG